MCAGINSYVFCWHNGLHFKMYNSTKNENKKYTDSKNSVQIRYIQPGADKIQKYCNLNNKYVVSASKLAEHNGAVF